MIRSTNRHNNKANHNMIKFKRLNRRRYFNELNQPIKKKT